MRLICCELTFSLKELLEVERELEEVKREFSAQSKEVEKEKEEREALESKLEEAEKERKKLRRQVTSLEADIEELRNREGGDEAEPSNHDEQEVDLRRLKELEDNMRLKNKQIHQLLEDIDQLEKDNGNLQDKVVSLRDELAEATRQIQMITSEYVAMKAGQADRAALVETLQQDNSSLRVQLEDQYQERARRDAQIQEISSQVDGKVEELKSIVNFKDAQIEELRSRLNRAVVTKDIVSENENSRQAVACLTRALKERDAEVGRLGKEVEAATGELEASAALIEQLKGGGGGKSGGDPLQKSLLAVRAQLLEATNQVFDSGSFSNVSFDFHPGGRPEGAGG